jgi:hypothetical protein
MPPPTRLLARNVRRAAIELTRMPLNIPDGLNDQLLHRVLFRPRCPYCFKLFKKLCDCHQHQAMQPECRAAAELTLRAEILLHAPGTGQSECN